MRVAIVGAGMAGLACARGLRTAGISCVIFEKSRGPGGRCATRRSDGFVWDTGATSLVPRGKRIQGALGELDSAGLVQIDRPVWVHSGLRPRPGDSRRNSPRYTWEGGMSVLPKRLAEGIEIRTETTVESVEPDGEGYLLKGERFDAVVLTPPMPQTSALLWRIGANRPVAAARYRACLTVGLGYAEPLGEIPYHALLDADGTHPLVWLSLESVKAPGRAPEGGTALMAQFSRMFSADHWRDEDAAMVRTAAGYIRTLYPTLGEPVATTVMRWKYSQAEGVADFASVNPPGERLVIAGDSLLGGHLEDAYETGAQAADHLIEVLS